MKSRTIVLFFLILSSIFHHLHAEEISVKDIISFNQTTKLRLTAMKEWMEQNQGNAWKEQLGDLAQSLKEQDNHSQAYQVELMANDLGHSTVYNTINDQLNDYTENGLHSFGVWQLRDQLVLLGTTIGFCTVVFTNWLNNPSSPIPTHAKPTKDGGTKIVAGSNMGPGCTLVLILGAIALEGEEAQEI